LLGILKEITALEKLIMPVVSQLHAPTALPPETEPPGTHWIGGSNDKNRVYPTSQLSFNLSLSLIASLMRT
jgi:hypothetical protein